MKDKVLKTNGKLSQTNKVICLIFDFDGTLAETEEAHRVALE